MLQIGLKISFCALIFAQSAVATTPRDNPKLALGISLLAVGTGLMAYAETVMSMDRFRHWTCGNTYYGQFLCCPANKSSCGPIVDYPNCSLVNETAYCVTEKGRLYPAQWNLVDWALWSGATTFPLGFLSSAIGFIVIGRAIWPRRLVSEEDRI